MNDTKRYDNTNNEREWKIRLKSNCKMNDNI